MKTSVMVHVLKNLSIRLWVAIAMGGLATLGLLAVFGSPLKPAYNLSVAAVLIALTYLTCGWIFNRIATLRLQDYLRVATAEERAARMRESTDAFQKAVDLFDSFLVSPLLRQRMGGDLSIRLAHFYMSRAVHCPKAMAFIGTYLWAHPKDGEVAEYWLQHVSLGNDADPEQLTLADRITAAQPGNPAIQSLMAQVYLSRSRTDYTALQTYQRLFRGSGEFRNQAGCRLADLFSREGRTDEWALEVYLEACRQAPGRMEYLQGIAVCEQQIRETGRNASLLEASRKALAAVDDAVIHEWRASFRHREMPAEEKGVSFTEKALVTFSGYIRFWQAAMVKATGLVRSGLSDLGKTVGALRQKSAWIGPMVKWFVVTAFAAVVILVAINTIRHILESKEPLPPSSSAVKKVPVMASSGRYTIQIGSFRNRSQAMKLTDKMLQLGYPAYWRESGVSDEDVWYYVRISRFPGKTEAKTFGDELKNKGIIDDFYVANYKAP